MNTAPLWSLFLLAFASGAFFALALFYASVDNQVYQSQQSKPIAKSNAGPLAFFDNLPITPADEGASSMNTASIQFNTIADARAFYSRRRRNRNQRAHYQGISNKLNAALAMPYRSFFVGDTTLV